MIVQMYIVDGNDPRPWKWADVEVRGSSQQSLYNNIFEESQRLLTVQSVTCLLQIDHLFDQAGSVAL